MEKGEGFKMNITNITYLPTYTPLSDIDIISKYCGFENGRIENILIRLFFVVLALILLKTIYHFSKEDTWIEFVSDFMCKGLDVAIISLNIYIGLYYIIMSSSDPYNTYLLIRNIGYPIMGMFMAYMGYHVYIYLKKMSDTLQ